MKLHKIFYRVLLSIINLLVFISAIHFFIVLELNSKRSAIDEFAIGLAPALWDFSINTPKVFLNNYIKREKHSEIVVSFNNNEIFINLTNNSVKANLFMPEIEVAQDVFFNEKYIGNMTTKYPSRVVFPILIFILIQIMGNLLVHLIRNLRKKNSNLTFSLAKLKETNQILNDTQTKLAVNDLIVGLSHEINTPIGNIVTSISYLEHGIRTDEIKKSSIYSGIDLINNSLKRIITIMDRIKQIEIDENILELSEFDLKEMVSLVFTTKKLKYATKRNRLNWIGPDTLPLRSKQEVWKKILEEIIDNAYLYSPDDSDFIIEYEAGEKYSRLRFITSGIKIPIETIPSIFHPFYTTQRTETQHIGLGLHLIGNLVEKVLNGRFFLERADDPVIFTLEFPD